MADIYSGGVQFNDTQAAFTLRGVLRISHKITVLNVLAKQYRFSLMGKYNRNMMRPNVEYSQTSRVYPEG